MVETDQTSAETAPRLALSIVIPVFNGAESVAELIGALEKLRIPGGHEIVLVNDGSVDNSLQVLHALFDNARVPMTLIDLARNYGEHNAVMAGLRHSGGAHVITMDDDLQNPPAEVQRLLAFSQRSGKQVVYTYYDHKRHPMWRNFASRFASRERSNYTVRRLIRLWMSMFVNFSVMPLRISTFTGIILSAFGALGGAIVVGEALFRSPPPGWASLMAAVLLLSGVQLLILGIVGEYLGRLYLTVNQKPQSIVKEVRRRQPSGVAERASPAWLSQSA